MGNFFGGGNAEDEEEEMEQERLKRWRPVSEHQQLAALRRKKASDKHSEGSEDGSGSGSASDAGSGGSSSVGAPDSEDSGDEGSQKGVDETKSQDSKDGASSSDASEGDGEKEAVEKLEEKRKKKLVVHMEFEPLLSLHEPLGALVEEPADIWANAKNTRKQNRIEKAAIEDALAANRSKAKAVAEWMAEMGLEDCMLNEAADAIEEEPDELRYALNASKHFEVDDRDGVVRKTLLQHILDAMDSDIETMQEVIDKLVNTEADEDAVRKAVQDSGGELRLKNANDIELIEHVNVEAELKQRRLEEKEQRLRAKEDKRKAGRGKKGRRGSLASRLSRSSDDSTAEAGGDSDSDSDEGTSNTQNKEAEKKALAFRRLQVQRKIEDFLWLYRNGQNLQKINSKGRRYNRRVYIDTSKRALVIQGASGPSFFPFINMKEIDIDTHTTKEGRVETHVICAMEKNGRIYKELVLAFPDQAKANNFVNSMTLFSLALRSAASR